MTFSTFLLIFTCFCLPGFTAGPIAHVYMAQQWIDSGLMSPDKVPAFIIGNLYPDIRYLGIIDREKTHEKGLSLETIVTSPSSFVAGKRLHAYVDGFREALVVKWRVYDLINAIADGHQATLLKLIEDDILYDRIDINFAIDCIDSLNEEEITEEVTYDSVLIWHTLLQVYFCKRPRETIAELAAAGKGMMGISPQTIAKWNRLLPELCQKKEFLDYVNRLSDEFQHHFQQHTN